MGMIVYIGGNIHNSPYASILNPDRWIEIHDMFMRDACSLLGVTVDSPLTTCINAGCKAIPALLNIKHIMKEQQVTSMLNGADELPVSVATVDVDRHYR